MNVEELYTDRGVCTFCHPHMEEELQQLTTHLIDPRTRNWVGGYTCDKALEYSDIKRQYEADKQTVTFCVCHETAEYICAAHVRELAARMEAEAEAQAAKVA
jgi:hypothetical protein